MSPTGVTLSRHDLLLAGIAVSLAIATLWGVLFPVGMPVALGVGCVPATGSIGYALFYRPPVGRTIDRSETQH